MFFLFAVNSKLSDGSSTGNAKETKTQHNIYLNQTEKGA